MQHDVTTEFVELIKHGFTHKELTDRFNIYTFENGKCVAYNRKSELGIIKLLEKTKREKAFERIITTGVSWIKFQGQWALIGMNLREGEKVMVYKKDGKQSIETVGKVVAKADDGRFIAYVAPKYEKLDNDRKEQRRV